jgi:hypothetical protein
MTKENVVQKIQKLLALSKSDNPNEAALAASMAQELMVKYAIEAHELDKSGVAAKEPIEVEPLGAGTRKIPRWQATLAHILSKHFFCKTYLTPGVDIHLVGRQTDREAFKVMFSYLVGEINRMCDNTWARVGAFTDTHGKSWKASFGHGAVDVIYKRLEANLTKLLNEAPEGAVNPEGSVTVSPAPKAPSTAIVLAARIEEVDSFLKANVENLRNVSQRRRVKADGYAHGKRAGEAISLDKRASKALKG